MQETTVNTTRPYWLLGPSPSVQIVNWRLKVHKIPRQLKSTQDKQLNSRCEWASALLCGRGVYDETTRSGQQIQFVPSVEKIIVDIYVFISKKPRHTNDWLQDRLYDYAEWLSPPQKRSQPLITAWRLATDITAQFKVQL